MDVKMIKKLCVLLLVTLCLVLSGCDDTGSTGHIKTQDGTAKLSLSSDGRYVIASTLHKKLFLFDIKNKTKKLLSNDANIYSAYFIKNTNDFLWQDVKSNIVYVENVNGQIVKQFNPGFPTYGQVMSSNLNLYFASNINFHLYRLYQNKWTSIQLNPRDVGFEGAGKLLNLQLSTDEKKLLTVGMGSGDVLRMSGVRPEKFDKYRVTLDGVTLWDAKSFKPIYGFPGNEIKTFASLSPNGNYVISGDEQPLGYVWDAKTGKYLYEVYNIHAGKFFPNKKNGHYFDKSYLKIMPPKDFIEPVVGATRDATISINFVDKTHYIRTVYDIPYGILYSVKSPSPSKYFKLNTKPYPSINDYSRDQSIDSSWQTHTFVTGQAIGDDITVYKYNPKNQTLNVVWISK